MLRQREQVLRQREQVFASRRPRPAERLAPVPQDRGDPLGSERDGSPGADRARTIHVLHAIAYGYAWVAPHRAPVARVRPSFAEDQRRVAVDPGAVVTIGPTAVGDLAKVARERREASRDLRALEDDPRSPANEPTPNVTWRRARMAGRGCH